MNHKVLYFYKKSCVHLFLQPQFKYFVYPNPTSGFVIINIAEPKAKELRIFSVEGKLQYKGKVLNEIIIDVRNWQKGLYLIRIENVMKKIIVN